MNQELQPSRNDWGMETAFCNFSPLPGTKTLFHEKLSELTLADPEISGTVPAVQNP